GVPFGPRVAALREALFCTAGRPTETAGPYLLLRIAPTWKCQGRGRGIPLVRLNHRPTRPDSSSGNLSARAVIMRGRERFSAWYEPGKEKVRCCIRFRVFGGRWWRRCPSRLRLLLR